MYGVDISLPLNAQELKPHQQCMRNGHNAQNGVSNQGLCATVQKQGAIAGKALPPGRATSRMGRNDACSCFNTKPSQPFVSQVAALDAPAAWVSVSSCTCKSLLMCTQAWLQTEMKVSQFKACSNCKSSTLRKCVKQLYSSIQTCWETQPWLLLYQIHAAAMYKNQCYRTNGLIGDFLTACSCYTYV